MNKGWPQVTTPPPIDGAGWVARLMSGDAAPEDHAACARWRLLTSANEEDYQRARRAWAASGDARIMFSARNMRSGFSKIVVAGIAAAAATMAVVFVFGVGTSARMPLTESYASLSAERVSVELTSGDNMTLNARAELTIEEGSDLTTVRLTNGEAFFEVVPDTSRTFVVETELGTITVTGTAFEVGRLAGFVSVAVQRGSVRVESRNAGVEPRLLRPGDRALVLPDGTLQDLGDIPPDIVAAWRKGSIVFLDEPIGLVFERLENYVGRPIVLSPDIDQDLRVSATFADSDVERVLSDLDMSLPIAVEWQSSGAIQVSAEQ